VQEVSTEDANTPGPIYDDEPLKSNGETIDQDDDDYLDREHELVASLIDKLKCEIDDSHNHNKFLESSNKI
ncbi:hypothetical protein Tco_1423114, partial [Tanacetum coccineum]